jgi:glutamate synthase domain-containing protein 3
VSSASESLTLEQARSVEIDASGLHYRVLNEQIRRAVHEGASHIVLRNVCGQRYICAGLVAPGLTVEIYGVPGNDLGIFMDGPTILCHDNAQDGVANTMNSGTIVVKRDAGDVLGYRMRGGRLFVLGSVGYRVGIHMKEFQDKKPAIVIGSKAGNFLGEYMAGGFICVLGLDVPYDEPVVGKYCGTGMHGGVMYVRQPIDEALVGKEVGFADMTDEDVATLSELVGEFCRMTGTEAEPLIERIEEGEFAKLYPYTKRPYGNLYSY